MNQYKIGFFSSISEGSNLIEIGNDFIDSPIAFGSHKLEQFVFGAG